MVEASLLQNPIGLPNGVRWMIQENASNRAGIPERLVVAVLLSRANQKLFKMAPYVEENVSGLAFEQAFARQPPDEPVIFDPEMPPRNPVSFDQSTYYETDLFRNNLEDFWHTQAGKITGVQFHLPILYIPRPLASNFPSDYVIAVTDGNEATDVPSVEPVDDSTRPIQYQSPEAFNKAVLGAVYTEVWDTKRESNRGMGALKFYWEDMGYNLDEKRLSEHFSRIKEELDLPLLPKVDGEGQNPQANEAENTRAETQQSHMERFNARHNSCTLV